MPLNDKQITERGSMIAPFVPEKTRTLNGVNVPSFGLGSMGYDPRLEPGSVREVKINTHLGYEAIDTQDPNSFRLEIVPSKNGRVLLQPGRFYLAATLERFAIPVDIIGVVYGKSTGARASLMLYVTPLEPGWEGHVTLEFSVTLPMWITEGAGIAQIVFLQGEETTTAYTGPYQNQAAEAVGAMVGHDEIVVKWDLVPVGYDWVAVDENKCLFAYNEEPFAADHLWLSPNFDERITAVFLDDYCVTLPTSFDWTQTLRRRPQ